MSEEKKLTYEECYERCHERMLQWRNLEPENVCNGRKGCGGSGKKTYASTSTWRFGMAGSMVTTDICDQCWGSGDIKKPWFNLRNFHELPKPTKN